MTNFVHKGDLPADVKFMGSVAVDTETTGLLLHRDRLCVVQLSAGDGDAHIVQLLGNYNAPNLNAVLANSGLEKIFHFARFDLGMLLKHLGLVCSPVYCTRTASRLCRTNTDRHGLKDLCKDLLGVELSKQQQSSDWAAEDLTPEQVSYAAADVLYLHQIKREMERLVSREKRKELAMACFKFLPHQAALDVGGWADEDIFAH